MPVGVGVWIGTRGSDESDEEVAYEHRVNNTRFSTPVTPTSSVSREARSSAPPQIPRSVISRGSSPQESESGIRIPIFSLPQYYQRTRMKIPAAELDDSPEGGGTPSRHGSWVSRVSRMLSRAARSSTTSRSSSRSRSRSGWTTTRRPASEEWEAFFQGRGGPGGGGLTVPNLTYTRPSSTASSSSASSSFPDERKDFFDLEDAARRLPKIKSFDRLSEGTFGLRGRSSDRSGKRKS